MRFIGTARAVMMAAVFAAGSLQAAAAAPIKLRFAAAGPAENNPLFIEVIQKWAKTVNDASGGELQIEPVPGVTLANPSNVWQRVQNGVADIGFGIHGAVGKPFPKTYVAGLPFAATDEVKGSEALWSLFEKGLISDEYKGVKVLALFVPPPSGLHSVNPITSIADVAGKKYGSPTPLLPRRFRPWVVHRFPSLHRSFISRSTPV